MWNQCPLATQDASWFLYLTVHHFCSTSFPARKKSSFWIASIPLHKSRFPPALEKAAVDVETEPGNPNLAVRPSAVSRRRPAAYAGSRWFARLRYSIRACKCWSRSPGSSQRDLFLDTADIFFNRHTSGLLPGSKAARRTKSGSRTSFLGPRAALNRAHCDTES